MRLISFLFLITTPVFAGVVPLKDNILFAFEKCKTLSVDLHKGQLKEAVASSFDVHCKRVADSKLDFNCDFFETGSDKKTSTSVFSGGSDLGKGELKDKEGQKISFLIGKNYASFESATEHKACIGIFIFEEDALKQKASSLKSGL